MTGNKSFIHCLLLKLDVHIYVDDILSIPYGGTSLWTKIWVNNAADIGFSLKLSFVT